MPHSQDPLGPVVIGAREIYDAVMRVGGAVERLTDQHADTEATVGQHDAQLRTLSAVPERLADHEGRLRVIEDVRPAARLANLETRVQSVESRQWPLPTVGALFGAAGLILGLLPYLR